MQRYSTFVSLLLWSTVLHCDAFSQDSKIRIATFNIALNRNEDGQLTRELAEGNCEQAMKVAEVIQRIRPDLILLNELDFETNGRDSRHRALDHFKEKYLGKSQGNQKPIEYPYCYFAPSNTGTKSGLDIDNDGKNDGPTDAFGFGQFSGQYAMAVLTRFPIKQGEVRTFQKFLWKEMPGAAWPKSPGSGKHFYRKSVRDIFRLSSKSHWDVPVNINGHTIHFLVAHPTPPVFDGPEDRNGCRNHDEIRFLADYVDPKKNSYIYDDKGKKGGLKTGALFVIAGDMNADPFDGASREQAINQLLKHRLINSDPIPSSQGAIEATETQGKKNRKHRGLAAHDTGDFNDESVGNLRIDYVLPSRTLNTVDSGVFWPKKNQPGHEAANASDHRLVWIDILLKQ